VTIASCGRPGLIEGLGWVTWQGCSALRQVWTLLRGDEEGVGVGREMG
jgi:hypothetical protein